MKRTAYKLVALLFFTASLTLMGCDSGKKSTTESTAEKSSASNSDSVKNESKDMSIQINENESVKVIEN